LIENEDGTCGNKTTNVVYKEILNMVWNIHIYFFFFYQHIMLLNLFISIIVSITYHAVIFLTHFSNQQVSWIVSLTMQVRSQPILLILVLFRLNRHQKFWVTKLQGNITPLSELRPISTLYNIHVRVSRTWEFRGKSEKNPLIHFDMVVVDQNVWLYTPFN
jgi:hypothetical protein